MIGSYGMKKKLQLPPMGFAKTFAKKLHDAASSKGNAEVFWSFCCRGSLYNIYATAR